MTQPTTEEQEANTNCLEGIRCPTCGSTGWFAIRCSAWFNVTDDGTEYDYEAEGPEWTDDSEIICGDCQHTGTVAAFRKEGVA